MKHHRKKSRPAKRHAPNKADRHASAIKLELFSPKCLAIEYMRDGKAYRHHFTKPPKLHKSKSGTILVLAPVKVDRWIRD